jgi:hypothetical protein
MRAVIFLALVGVAIGNLCADVSRSEINKIWSKGRLAATLILGQSCPTFNLDKVAFGGDCKSLVRQSTCYGINAASHYGSGVVDYGTLAADVPNLEHLGNLACAKAEACYDQVKTAIDKCIVENSNFVADTVAAAEKAYKENFEKLVKDFAASNSGSFFGDMASIARDRFTSAADIQDFLEAVISDDIRADAAAAADEAAALAQQWCADGCTSKSAKFLKRIFSHMNGGECTNARVFCGACEDRANSYFTNNRLPCCIENVVQKSIEAYDYAVENYEAAILEYRDQLKAAISESAYTEAVNVGTRVVEQFNCVASVYNAQENACV